MDTEIKKEKIKKEKIKKEKKVDISSLTVKEINIHKPYPPIIEKQAVINYRSKINDIVFQIFKHLTNNIYLNKLSIVSQSLKIIKENDINYRSNIICRSYNKIIYLNEEIFLTHTVLDIREILIHEIAHNALFKNHYHDFVWRRIVKNLGGNPCIRGCNITKPETFPYILCCPDETCIGSISQEFKNISNVKMCSSCHSQQKIFILND